MIGSCVPGWQATHHTATFYIALISLMVKGKKSFLVQRQVAKLIGVYLLSVGQPATLIPKCKERVHHFYFLKRNQYWYFCVLLSCCVSGYLFCIANVSFYPLLVLSVKPAMLRDATLRRTNRCVHMHIPHIIMQIPPHCIVQAYSTIDVSVTSWLRIIHMHMRVFPCVTLLLEIKMYGLELSDWCPHLFWKRS